MKESSKNILVAFLLNLSFTIIEIIGGFLTNSIAILSDAIHDLGDSISIGMSFYLEKKSEQKPDASNTYGYARYSVLGALITSIILLIGSIIVIYTAITRIVNPEPVNSLGMIILAVLGVIVNGLAVLRTAKGEKLNEKAINLHMLEDTLGWVIVLIGSIVMVIFDMAIIDSILTILVSLYILFHVYKNIKQVFEIFLEKTPLNLNIEELKKDIQSVSNNISDVHHVHAWSLDGVSTICTMHVLVKNNLIKDEIVKLKEEIKERAEHKFNISHLTIELEFSGEKCKDRECSVGKGKSCHHHHHHH